jgi:hypothetical protein
MGQIFRHPLWTAPKPKTKINETFFATHLSDHKISEVRRLKASLILVSMVIKQIDSSRYMLQKKLFLNQFDLIWLSRNRKLDTVHRIKRVFKEIFKSVEITFNFQWSNPHYCP